MNSSATTSGHSAPARPKSEQPYRLEEFNIRAVTILANLLLYSGILLAVPTTAYLLMLQEYLWAVGIWFAALFLALVVFLCFSVRGVLKLLIEQDRARLRQEQLRAGGGASGYASASSISRSPFSGEHAAPLSDPGLTEYRTSSSQIVENEMIQVRCPSCRSQLACNEILIGHNVRCKKCNHRFEVTEDLVQRSPSSRR